MSDKELLELAANAAGYGEVWYLEGYDTPYIGKKYDGTSIGYRVFRPLDDDGDALRLAVKLKLHVDANEIECVVFIHGSFGKDADGKRITCKMIEEDHNDDPYAATRRAIVRAAAEIGRSMK